MPSKMYKTNPCCSTRLTKLITKASLGIDWVTPSIYLMFVNLTINTLTPISFAIVSTKANLYGKIYQHKIICQIIGSEVSYSCHLCRQNKPCNHGSTARGFASSLRNRLIP